eukprot:2357589-Alexandrium_andersonii.AAC.1
MPCRVQFCPPRIAPLASSALSVSTPRRRRPVPPLSDGPRLQPEQCLECGTSKVASTGAGVRAACQVGRVTDAHRRQCL